MLWHFLWASKGIKYDIYWHWSYSRPKIDLDSNIENPAKQDQIEQLYEDGEGAHEIGFINSDTVDGIHSYTRDHSASINLKLEEVYQNMILLLCCWHKIVWNVNIDRVCIEVYQIWKFSRWYVSIGNDVNSVARWMNA